MKTIEQVKKEFRQSGETVSEWARKHGFQPQKVIALLNGNIKGHRGKSHEIAVALGIK